MNAWLIPLAAYLLGAIPFGYLIVRFSRGRDIRSAGSGNIGAANVSREAGLGAGLATLALDAGKGWLAVWGAGRWTDGDIFWMSVAAASVVAGHLFTVFLRFRGGKGVATGAGAFVPICWPAVAAALGIWFVVVVFWRYVSLGSIVAAASLPVLTYVLYAPGFAPPRAVTAATTLAAVLIVLKHRGNLQRLVAGNEPRFTLRRRND